MLNKRDVETARLREQRDQYQAEINERKAREQNKVASAQEFKALADTRAVCSDKLSIQIIIANVMRTRNVSQSWSPRLSDLRRVSPRTLATWTSCRSCGRAPLTALHTSMTSSGD